MHNPEQTELKDSNQRIEDMNDKPISARFKSAPLYASPWLALFYLIRQGLEQFRL